jgi:hypothetical protein
MATINNRKSRQRKVGLLPGTRPGSRCRCLARTLSLSYCRSIGGPDLHPTPLSSLDTEFQPLMKALCLQASMACIDIRLQKRPNPARDCLTKLCRQSLSQPAALLGCAMGHQDRAAVAVGHETALAKPSLWPVVAAGVPSVGRGRLGRCLAQLKPSLAVLFRRQSHVVRVCPQGLINSTVRE